MRGKLNWNLFFQGCWHAGIGHTALDKVFGVLEIPFISSQAFKKQERFIGPKIEEVADESCKKAVL